MTTTSIPTAPTYHGRAADGGECDIADAVRIVTYAPLPGTRLTDRKGVELSIAARLEEMVQGRQYAPAEPRPALRHVALAAMHALAEHDAVVEDAGWTHDGGLLTRDPTAAGRDVSTPMQLMERLAWWWEHEALHALGSVFEARRWDGQ